MTADRAATERLVEEMTEALAGHRLQGAACACGDWQGYWGDWHAHVARALLAGPVGEALAAAKREALEDAADAWSRGQGAGQFADAWLRNRATGAQP